MDTAIVGYQVSNNLTLTTQLIGLETAIEAAARANLAHILESDDYTLIEQRAMLTVEMLKQVNGLDLVAILMRGKYLQQITEENMLADHPEQYTSLEEMAKKQGISASELSQTRDLVTVIFPYIESVLEIPVHQIWYDIGKSNFREITPVLKALISGEAPGRGSTREAVEAILDDIETAKDYILQNDPEISDADAQSQAFEQTVNGILEDAAHLTNNQLRRRIRPQETEPIQIQIINAGGEHYIVANVDEDQLAMLNRKMREAIEAMTINLPADPQLRMIEASRIPEIRRLAQLVGQV